MNVSKALLEIAGRMHSFNLGVCADDHASLVAEIAEIVARWNLEDGSRDSEDRLAADTAEHVEALAEQRPPANWACGGRPRA